jgi:hypothetical protein
MNTKFGVHLFEVIDDYRSTFGVCEFEVIAKSIVNYLKSDKRSSWGLTDIYKKGYGWEKAFTIKDATDRPDMFAAMCSLGYFQHLWFPKGTFSVTEKFIKRLPLKPYEERK